MRLMLTLKANDDMLYDTEYYTKLQGFFYRLLFYAGFKDLHDTKGFKYFSFSNIFPYPEGGKIHKGDIKKVIFASPNKEYVKKIAEVIKEVYLKQEINIGYMRFNVEELKTYTLKLRKGMLIRTATPAVIRIPSKMYSLMGLNREKAKDKFLYWRPELGTDVFVNLAERNLRKKFCSFYGNCKTQIHFIEAYRLIKAPVVVNLLIKNTKIKVTGSLWEFYYPDVSDKAKEISFMLDAGIGERNSYGFGFLNVLKS